MTIPSQSRTPTERLRRAVLFVAFLNFTYGVIEFIVALQIGSVSLFADSVDFFEDASVNLLIFFALAWTLQARARIGMALAVILFIPALAGLWVAIQKLQAPVPPDSFLLGITGLGALGINVFCAWLLASYRHAGGRWRVRPGFPPATMPMRMRGSSWQPL